MHRLRALPPALRVTVYAVAITALIALSVGIGVTATLLYERGIGSGGGAASEQASNQEEAQTSPDSEPTQMSPDEYLTTVGPIQNGFVETFLDSHTRLSRYDTLTGGDVDVLEANYLTLGAYSDQVENLNPPEEYADQYELFSLAISELYAAGEIAHRVTDVPPSATQVDFREYDEHVETATASLQQSNQILGQSYATTVGVSRVSLI